MNNILTQMFPFYQCTHMLLHYSSISSNREVSESAAVRSGGGKENRRIFCVRLGYVPKMLSTPFRAQVITLSVFLPPTGSEECLLCPVRALRIYTERCSALYRESEQLLLASVSALKVPLLRSRAFLGGWCMLSH